MYLPAAKENRPCRYTSVCKRFWSHTFLLTWTTYTLPVMHCTLKTWYFSPPKLLQAPLASWLRVCRAPPAWAATTAWMTRSSQSLDSSQSSWSTDLTASVGKTLPLHVNGPRVPSCPTDKVRQRPVQLLGSRSKEVTGLLMCDPDDSSDPDTTLVKERKTGEREKKKPTSCLHCQHTNISTDSIIYISMGSRSAFT